MVDELIYARINNTLVARGCGDDDMRGFAVRMVMEAIDILPTLDEQVQYGVAIYQAQLWGRKVDKSNNKLKQWNR